MVESRLSAGLEVRMGRLKGSGVLIISDTYQSCFDNKILAVNPVYCQNTAVYQYQGTASGICWENNV